MTDERPRPPARRPAPRPQVRRPAPARKPAARRPAPRKPVARRASLSPRKAAQPRLKASLAVVLVLLVVLGSRMVQLQGIDSAAYSKRAEAQRSQTVTLAATRGAITDRWGHVLADDLDLRLIFVDPTLEMHAQATADALAPVINVPAATLLPELERKGTRYVPLAHLVEPSVAVKVLALRYPEPGHPATLIADPAIGVNHETTRDHPGKDLAAALVGVTSKSTSHGLTGIEALLDGTLSGTPGQEDKEVDPSGTPIPDGTHLDVPAVDGSSVRLTIDRDLQYEAQTALDAQVKASDARGGQIIVMDPKTGQVLALASAPEFDASQPITSSDDLHIPALETSYEPGSVNKVITASAAIQNGVVTPSTHISVPSEYHYPGRIPVVKDAEVHGTEPLTFTGVLAESSNIGTDIVAQQVGDTTVAKTLKAFGLGQPSGLAYPGETAGIVPQLPWSPYTASTIPFGQGMSVTALQIADAYQAIANGGVRIPAQLVRSTVSPDGAVHPYPGQQAVRVVSTKTAKTVAQMLEAVTDQGTAPEAQIPGYRVAGKTGTAQAVDPKNGTYEGGFVDSFVGFAPADNPRLLVEVVIDRPGKGSHFGGAVAGPVFAGVMGFGLREFDVAPTGTKRADYPLCYAAYGCPVPQ